VAIFRPKKPKPPEPPKPEPPKPEPPKPTPEKKITRDTPFRSIGTLSPERVCEILDGYPMESECRAIGELQANALPLAQSFLESTYGKAENAQRSKNPLGLFSNGQFRSFDSWTRAFAEWQRRMADPTYGGGVYMPQNKTLHDFIITYVCGPNCTPGMTRCGVDGSESYAECEAYLDKTVDRLNRYFGTTPPSSPPPTTGPYRDHSVAGSEKPLRLPAELAFKQQLTPFGILNPAVGRPNRSGIPLAWRGNVQHSTGNTRNGANAQMHANWQNGGTPGHPDGVVAVHFYVDDTQAIQCLPVDERGIHAGDARNATDIAIELCVNADRNPQKAENNAVALQAGLLHILGKSGTEAMSPHTFNATGHCPKLSVPWSQWEQRVDRAIDAIP
jgi:hypothetical protein